MIDAYTLCDIIDGLDMAPRESALVLARSSVPAPGHFDKDPVLDVIGIYLTTHDNDPNVCAWCSVRVDPWPGRVIAAHTAVYPEGVVPIFADSREAPFRVPGHTWGVFVGLDDTELWAAWYRHLVQGLSDLRTHARSGPFHPRSVAEPGTWPLSDPAITV